ncbi:MAG: hypothetical protein LBT43_20950 [Prevotella sp.]|jgi:hypothetical protein|nr:hypothetical protein [Prevotella sp.]
MQKPSLYTDMTAIIIEENNGSVYATLNGESCPIPNVFKNLKGKGQGEIRIALRDYLRETPDLHADYAKLITKFLQAATQK